MQHPVMISGGTEIIHVIQKESQGHQNMMLFKYCVRQLYIMAHPELKKLKTFACN